MFENLHKTKGYAFLDGVLCGALTLYYASFIQKRIIEDRERSRAIAQFPGSQKS